MQELVPFRAGRSRGEVGTGLLYRFGIPVDNLAFVETRYWDPLYSHLFTVVRIAGTWYDLDGVCSDWYPELPQEPGNITCVETVDYSTPRAVAVLPGSTITRPMLIQP